MNIKQLFLGMVAFATVFTTSCQKEDPIIETPTYEVSIKVEVPTQYTDALDVEAIEVTAQNGETSYSATTNIEGVALFTIPAGVYDITASASASYNGELLSFNAVKNSLAIESNWDIAKVTTIEFVVSQRSQLIIKELYTAGCVSGVDPTSSYSLDKYVVIYNNSNIEASLDNVGFAILDPWNAHGINNWTQGGSLLYESESWIPASHGIWYFQNGKTLAPYSEVVVAINGGIDHTLVHPASVNLSNADFVMYDPESGYNHASYYPAPNENITSDRYLKAVVYGIGSGWVISNTAPALVLFVTKGTTPEEFANDISKEVYPIGKEGNNVFACRELPKEWVLDCVDVWSSDKIEDSSVRFSANVNVGHVIISAKMGAVVYRNVDKVATEAIEGNETKLVYNYNLGTEANMNGSTDPSGIDAKASMAAGAKIVFSDINNSSKDFHQRKVSSLK